MLQTLVLMIASYAIGVVTPIIYKKIKKTKNKEK